METWSISYTADKHKAKNRCWLQGKMNYNTVTGLAHFYDEDGGELGKQKMQAGQVRGDAEVSLWKHLIEIGVKEEVREAIEDVFERLNKELGIEEFDNKHSKKVKLADAGESKFNNKPATVQKPLLKPKIPTQAPANEPFVMYDILYSRTAAQKKTKVWCDGFMKLYSALKVAEFYGDDGKLMYKKVIGGEEVKEGMIVEAASGLVIEVSAKRKEHEDTEHTEHTEHKEHVAEVKVHNDASTNNNTHNITDNNRIFNVLYTTDKHKKSKKWLDARLEYNPTSKLAKFTDEESGNCFYKKVMSAEEVAVGNEFSTGLYLIQIDHEISINDENKGVKRKMSTTSGAATEKFKPSFPFVLVVSTRNVQEMKLKESLTVLRCLMGMKVKKIECDIVLLSDYESLCAQSLKSFPLPLLHHRPSDLVLFEESAMLKFILGETGSSGYGMQGVCAKIVALAESSSRSSNSEILALVDALNKNFRSDASESEKIVLFSLLKRVKIDNSLLSGAINSWLDTVTIECREGDMLSDLLKDNTVVSCVNGVNEEFVFKPFDKTSKVLPCEDGSTKNILITSALPYVNNVPHLGNIVGAVLSADVYARYCRRVGYRTLYICGTDEYGTATETKALEEGMTCQEICDKYFKMHASIYDWFQIEFDAFGRSSTSVQTEITHEIFKHLYDNGFFFAKSVDQCYCEGCARFLADRYVEGTCPLCGFDDARGDQCDGCGKLLNAVELKNPQCKLCRSCPVVRSSNHLFLDLSKLQEECQGFVESAGKNWSANSLAIARAWLTEGLRPRCMTRDLKWGTSVPMPGFEDKVFYVWFDAPIGYISITAGYDGDNWRKWWQNPEKVELHQFMGKDNVPFHTVIFPSTLLGTKQPWTLLHQLNSTEYLNYEGGKFSKSRGTGVFGSDARDSGIPASIWRYYLLASRPESTDAAFSWSDFVAKTNSELLANLGNFVNRATRFVAAKFDSCVPVGTLSDADKAFLSENVLNEIAKYRDAMETCQLRASLKCAMAVSAAGNLYLAEQKLDNKLLQGNPERCGTVIAVALNLCYTLSVLLEPFIPGTAADILQILNLPPRKFPSSTCFELVINPGHRINQPFHLFTKLEEGAVGELKAKFAGKQQSKVSVTEAAAN